MDLKEAGIARDEKYSGNGSRSNGRGIKMRLELIVSGHLVSVSNNARTAATRSGKSSGRPHFNGCRLLGNRLVQQAALPDDNRQGCSGEINHAERAMPTSESLKTHKSPLAAILAMMLWAPAHSQSIGADVPHGELQEIVVTAQRREQSLQDVGVSISAVSSEELRDLGITDSRDISKAVPGVLLTGFGSGDVDANLTLRGISQGDVSSFQESPNSLYIDDVYLSSANAAAFQLYDLERVEVLRGPQGTLFGRASSGGLADFITARPTRNWEGYAETGYSSFNDAYGEAAIGGPISDSVRFWVSTRYERADGWFENGLPGNDATFAKRFFGIRVQLEADVTDKLNARFSVSYDDNPRHDEGAYRNVPWYYVNGQPAPLPKWSAWSGPAAPSR